MRTFTLQPPDFIQVEIIGRCNLKCTMCPLTAGITGSSSEGGEIPGPVWEEVKRFASGLGRILVCGFGESLLHRDFIPMLRELDDLGIVTSFSTNGIGAERIARQLHGLRHLDFINVSIDSPDPVIYKEIRGGLVEKALTGYRALVAEGPIPDRVSISSVLMRRNLSSLREFPRLIHEAGGKLLMLQGLNGWNEDLEDEHLHKGRRFFTLFPQRRLHTVMDEIKAESARYGIDLQLSHRSQLDAYRWDDAVKQYYRRPADGTPVTRACMVPWHSMYVDSRGKVYPCCESAGAEPVGDLATEGLHQIWTGEALGRFRSNLTEPGQTPQVCLDCYAAPFGVHPLTRFRAELISLAETSPDNWTCLVRNTGSEVWDETSLVRIGASRPHDRESALWHSSWLSRSRICGHQEARVGPGEVATFSLQVSQSAEEMTESFQLVAEGQIWLPETVFELPAGPGASHLLNISSSAAAISDSNGVDGFAENFC